MDHLFPTDPAPDRAPTRLPLRTARPLVPLDRADPLDPEPSFRVGEAERAAACDALADHFAAGRLDPAELDDRLARAVAARSQADLRVLFADLRPRRAVAEADPPASVAQVAAGAALPALVATLVLCLLLAGGLLLLLGASNPALFVAALVGGTATAVAGGCVVAVGRATLRRR